jgi:hypothetical protein
LGAITVSKSVQCVDTTMNSLLPVGCPGHRHLSMVTRNSVEELASIVILAEVRDPSSCIERYKVRPVEFAGEIFSDTATQRSARIDRELEQPHWIVRSFQWHLHKVGTLVLQAEQANMAQVRRVCPFLQVLGSVESECQVDCVRQNHNPALRGSVPDDFGVSELCGVGRDDWVVGVGFKGVSSISAVCDGLLLGALHASGVLGESVDGYDAVVLVWEEPGGVVHVDYGGA